MLPVVSDREVAKEAARVNVSALVHGLPRIVPSEARFPADTLRSVITRGVGDLDWIRHAVGRLVERAAPRIERLRDANERDLERER
jgi:hypothetical protein